MPSSVGGDGLNIFKQLASDCDAKMQGNKSVHPLHSMNPDFYTLNN